MKKMTIISYDIREPGRLRRVANHLLDYAGRVQYSLFEAELNNKNFADLREKIKTIIDADDDIEYHRLCHMCESRIIRLGLQQEHQQSDFFIL